MRSMGYSAMVRQANEQMIRERFARMTAEIPPCQTCRETAPCTCGRTERERAVELATELKPRLRHHWFVCKAGDFYEALRLSADPAWGRSGDLRNLWAAALACARVCAVEGDPTLEAQCTAVATAAKIAADTLPR